jgi:hypothetical protein
MAKRSTRHHLCTPPRGLSPYSLSSRAGLNPLYRRRLWRTQDMAILVLIGLLLLAVAVLSPAPGLTTSTQPCPLGAARDAGHHRAGGHAPARATPDRPVRKSWPAFYERW